MSEQNPQHHSHAYHIDKAAHKDGALLHGHDDGHGGGHHHGDDEGDHGSFKSYMTGFILSVILTAIPFWLVMAKVLPSDTTGFVVLGFAAVQVVVHMIFFLHMNTRAEGGWSMLALVFTAVILFIMLSGSLWVMYHMNHNMMPGMMDMS
jgi:cytochrome o ubiquinol oxidase operon protein cyoD